MPAISVVHEQQLIITMPYFIKNSFFVNMNSNVLSMLMQEWQESVEQHKHANVSIVFSTDYGTCELKPSACLLCANTLR